MLQCYRKSYSFIIKGSNRGWYFNRLNWIGRYYAKLLSILCIKILYGFVLKPYKIFCFLRPFTLHSLINFLKSNQLLKIHSLTDIFVVDYPNSFDGRFAITYCFWSYAYSFRLIVRTFINIFQPLLSLTNFYASANWLEREAWDLYGIKFLLHPDLRRILTDYGFSGHPLRKDFPLIGFVELRYDDSFHSIILEPLELTQDFRFFKFYNPWLIK